MIFGYYFDSHTFIRIFLSSTTGFGNLTNSKGGPYYLVATFSVNFFLILSVATVYDY